MLIQVATQVAFTVLGAGLLWRLPGEAAATLARWTVEVAAVAVAAVAAFFALQRLGSTRGLERRLSGLLRRVIGPSEPDAAARTGPSVRDALDAVWGRDRRGRWPRRRCFTPPAGCSARPRSGSSSPAWGSRRA